MVCIDLSWFVAVCLIIWVFVRKCHNREIFVPASYRSILSIHVENFLIVDKCHSHAYHVIYPYNFFLLRVSMCPKSCENLVSVTHDMLQSVIVSGVVIYI